MTSVARKWLDEGLEDRCITRDLSWGVPVPRDGFEGKVFYVWFDAPIGYIAAVKEWADARGEDWREWWRPGPGIRYTQFLAKDNIPFHALTFPATLLGSGADIRLVDRIKGFNWRTWGDGKFSTSEKRGIFTDAALEGFPAGYWRWWLTANAPENADVRFTVRAFADGVNADLADTLGNLVNRLLRFTVSKFGDKVPEAASPGPAEERLAERVAQLSASCAANHEAVRLRRVADDLRALWSLVNEYLSAEAPWSCIATDPDRAACIVRSATALVGVAAAASHPVIPFAASRILACLGQTDAPTGRRIRRGTSCRPAVAHG